LHHGAQPHLPRENVKMVAVIALIFILIICGIALVATFV
jgi:hypothetical protein